MGFKSLTLQMIPFCFHVSFRPDDPLVGHPSPQPAAIRLILPDGRVRVYRRPVTADELMAANPCHLVCSSDSFIIGQKVPPLHAGDFLVPGQSYFLLPSNFFSSVLSFVSLAASFSSTASTIAASKFLLLRPFEVQKTATGRIQLRVSDDFVGRLTEEDEEGEGRKREGMVCTTEELARVYRELVMSVRVWKPKLEAISESEKKRRGGGGGAVFSGMRRRKKKSHKEQKH
ncbi:hypothetical protein KSP40_PGU005206 [Platanthera guangdongensis]|uniref:Uncharacterized protein n=1 Tax=Platanthera guangdongensis TaxID=2320717 RepID=A0ABR2MQW4_9ASPA